MRRFRIVLALLLGVLAAVGARAVPAPAGGPPEVVKVEPPSWWPGHTLHPVRLLVRGKNLAGARVLGADGVEIGFAGSNAGGSYLFVDVLIAPEARPGPRRLTVTTAAGSAVVPFEVAAPLPREGRFQGFSPDDVIYLAMPDRFANGDPSNDDPAGSKGLFDRRKGRDYHGGDLQGLIDRLAYLQELGVTALWLNPWYDNVDHRNEKEQYGEGPITDYHGYGAVDFYGVEEHLGTLGTLRRLVDEAHRRGIKVIQDQVANHTGPYHPWVEDPPTPTWYNGTAKRHLANRWQTWTFADPYATEVLQEETLRGWFVDILPDLDQDDEEAARYLIQNALWWVGATGIDGIRQDTIPYVHRRFWRDWRAALAREYPRLSVVGEMFDADPALVSFFQGGRARFDGIDSGFESVFDFPLYFALRGAFAQGKPLREVAKMLARDRLYEAPEKLVTFLGLHDVDRFMNEPGATLDGLKLAFTFLMTARGIPLVYYGDEIALPGGGDPDNRRDFPGGWPGDPRSAFEGSGRTAEEQSVFEQVRRLIRIRKELEPLRRGSTVTLHAEEQSYAFARRGPSGTVVVALNNAPQAASLDIEVGAAGLTDGAVLRDRLGEEATVRVENGRLRLRLGPRSGVILAP